MLLSVSVPYSFKTACSPYMVRSITPICLHNGSFWDVGTIGSYSMMSLRVCRSSPRTWLYSVSFIYSSLEIIFLSEKFFEITSCRDIWLSTDLSNNEHPLKLVLPRGEEISSWSFEGVIKELLRRPLGGVKSLRDTSILFSSSKSLSNS